ncbi:MAG TPA: VOC family protein [Longimicrobium sp.]
MPKELPGAVPEIPVSDMEAALAYYKDCLGFSVDWGGKDGGIAGVSRGQCRIFLTDHPFRAQHGNSSPVVTWLNLDSKAAVDAQHEEWKVSGATIMSPPESKPWMLHEFTAVDLDGNVFRVFYDFSRDSDA